MNKPTKAWPDGAVFTDMEGNFYDEQARPLGMKVTRRPPELAMLGYELDGVLADVKHGQGGKLDPVCMETLKRVSARLHQLAAGELAVDPVQALRDMKDTVTPGGYGMNRGWNDIYRDGMRAGIDMAIAKLTNDALAAGVLVTATPGYKLAPLEPTDEMLRVDVETQEFIGIDDARTIYKAMVAAAPAAAGVMVPAEVDRDTDGELLIDWSPGKGRMVTLSLRADGRLSYAFAWDGEKSHGTAQMPAGVKGTDNKTE